MASETASSPPREESPFGLIQPNQTASKKRKRAPVAAPSPAPSEQGGPVNPTEAVDVLSARNDLLSRARLTISRVPTFVPIADGSEFYTTEQLPMNHVGFRYTPAGINSPDFVAPCCTIESNPTSFRVGWEDRSPFVKVTKDGLGLLGDKGFRSARCNAPVREGRWFMEVKIERGGGEHMSDSGKQGSHVRLGWGRREAPLNAPVGLDGYSYGIRDKTGEKVTLSRPRPYGRPFSSNDVVGMYIALPPRRQADENDTRDPARIKRERIAIDFKGQEYFEALEYPQSKEMISLVDYSGKSANSASLPSSSSKKSATVKNVPERGRTKTTHSETVPTRPLPTLPGSHIAFFINGECQGIAFQDLYDYLQLRTTVSSRKGKEKKKSREGAHEHKENPFDDGTLGYYPFISLFNSASVRINPGPNFDYPPPPDIDAVLTGEVSGTDTKERTWRPMCERYPEYMREQWALDNEEEEEARAESVLRAALEEAEAEKVAQKNKKRQLAEARKRAKKAAAVVPALDDDRFGPTASLTTSSLGQPSPLRHGVAYSDDTLDDRERSPVPTIASSVDIQGIQGGYDSDNMEGGEGEELKDGSVTYHESPQTRQYMWTDPILDEGL